MTEATNTQVKTVIEVTSALVDSIKSLEKKSPQIRALYKLALENGYKDGPTYETREFILGFFKEHLGTEIRYQHIYNVLNTNLKKS